LGFPQLGFCDLPLQQQHAHNLTCKKKISAHNLHLIQASNANTRRLFVSIAYSLAQHREGEDQEKRQQNTNTTTKHRTLRRRESEAIPVLKKRIFSYFYCSSILL
jgi:hypothetical protein